MSFDFIAQRKKLEENKKELKEKERKLEEKQRKLQEKKKELKKEKKELTKKEKELKEKDESDAIRQELSDISEELSDISQEVRDIRQQLMHNQDAMLKVLELIVTVGSAAANAQPHSSNNTQVFADLKVDKWTYVENVVKDFKYKLSDCVTPGVAVDLPADGTDEDAMQMMLHNVAENLKDDLPSVLQAAKKSNQVPVAFELNNGEKFKPDGVIYNKLAQNVQGGIVGFIELKKKGETLGYNEELQLLKCINAILQIQPHRDFCFGVLTNGVHAMLYKGVRKPKRSDCEFRLICSINFGDGPLLAWLLMSEANVLGWSKLEVTLPGNHTHHLKTFIGSGQYCDAYELEVGETKQKVVMKHYRNAKKAEQERKVCKQLDEVSNVARLAPEKFQPEDKLFVAIEQRGYPFDASRPMNKKHAKCLVEAVEALHRKGIAHCDIFEGNIYWLSDNEAMLSDWSHVVSNTTANAENFEQLCTEDFEKLATVISDLGSVRRTFEANGYMMDQVLSKRKRNESATPEKSLKKCDSGAATKAEE